jgi:hypothetical protein
MTATVTLCPPEHGYADWRPGRYQTPKQRERICSRFPRLRVGPLPAFQFFGTSGFIVALVATGVAAAPLHISWLVVLGLWGSALAASAATALLTKVLIGHETLVSYHHQIAILAVDTAIIAILSRPLLEYLDVVAVGIGAFLAVGRLGCLAVGCCHGRPSRRGVRYGDLHVTAGFPAALAGVPLVPVAGLEALWLAFLTVVDVAQIWHGSPPGTALTTFVVGYAVGRGVLEVWRGDERAQWGGVSEAQWTGILLCVAVVVAELLTALPRHGWQGVTTLGLIAGMGILAWRRRSPAGWPPSPRQQLELAALLRVLPSSVGTTVHVGATSFGLKVSRSSVAETGAESYTVSMTGTSLSRRDAAALGRFIVRLQGLDLPARHLEIISHRDVHHVLV